MGISVSAPQPIENEVLNLLQKHIDSDIVPNEFESARIKRDIAKIISLSVREYSTAILLLAQRKPLDSLSHFQKSLNMNANQTVAKNYISALINVSKNEEAFEVAESYKLLDMPNFDINITLDLFNFTRGIFDFKTAEYLISKMENVKRYSEIAADCRVQLDRMKESSDNGCVTLSELQKAGTHISTVLQRHQTQSTGCDFIQLHDNQGLVVQYKVNKSLNSGQLLEMETELDCLFIESGLDDLDFTINFRSSPETQGGV